MNYAQARQNLEKTGWHFTVRNDNRIWAHECCCTKIPATEEDIKELDWIHVGDLILGPAHEYHETKEEAEACLNNWRRDPERVSLDGQYYHWAGCEARFTPVNEEVENCPQPYWHKTHRYCPACPWTENYDKVCDKPTKNHARIKDVGGLHDVALCEKHLTVEDAIGTIRDITYVMYS